MSNKDLSMNRTKKISIIAFYLALAIVLYLIERIIPLPTNIPGVKMGLANIITIVTIFTLPPVEVVFLAIARTFITSFLVAGFTAFWFSLSGALLSMLVMYGLIFRANRFFSLPTISVVGALAHNMGQLLIASWLVKTSGIFFYLPILAISAVASGFFVGITAKKVLIFLYKRGYVTYISELKALMSK